MTARSIARESFREFTGHSPDGVWSAPGRVNLIGEHTDYNDGFVLPFAIEQRTYAAVGLNHSDRIRVRSTFAENDVTVHVADLDTVFPTPAGSAPRVPAWSAYVLGVAWALQQSHAGREVPGVDIAIASDVPIGAGLSSSAAVECAVAVALDELWQLESEPTALAAAGRRAENDAVGAPTGIMDQLASMMGRPDSATFIDCRSLSTASLSTGFADAGLDVLVIDTRVRHDHSTGGYRERRADCEHAARVLGVPALRDLDIADLAAAETLLDRRPLRRVRHVVTENQRVLGVVEALTERGPHAIGDLLVASHRSLRDDFEVSVPELDVAVDATMAAGAIGARMTGGGFGGSAIAVVHRHDVPTISAAVRARFQAAGFAAPHIFTVAPAAGARRDE